MSLKMGLLGRKIGMTQVLHDDGTALGVTAVTVGPCVVVGKRTPEKHGYSALQLGFEDENVRQGRLTAIPGRPPDLVDLPDACRFAPRCPYASRNDSCTAQLPELRELRPGHLVRTAHPASERQGAPVPAAAP